MANITKLDLDIKKGSRNSTVTVTYEICFTQCEVDAGFYYYDYADMYGSDPGADDLLFRVGGTNCFKAVKKCIPRKYTRNVNNSKLDEDPGFLFFNKGDEVYAKACVKPVQPSGDCANSTIHHDKF